MFGVSAVVTPQLKTLPLTQFTWPNAPIFVQVGAIVLIKAGDADVSGKLVGVRPPAEPQLRSW